jgi:polysaccharide export outer membrane protein
MKNLYVFLAFSLVATLACAAQAITKTIPSYEAPYDAPVNSSASEALQPASTLAKLKPAAGSASDEADVPKPSADAPDNAFTIIAGDVLQITVWKEDGMDREILVLPDGSITFPLIGTIQAQGLTLSALQALIKEKLATLIPDASVTVMVKAPLGHSVSVIGQVTKPGEIIMSHHMGVMEALSQVGGLTPYASTSHIIILRYVDGKKTSIPFPYDDVAKGYHLDKDIDLKPGDVVVVPTAGLL